MANFCLMEKKVLRFSGKSHPEHTKCSTRINENCAEVKFPPNFPFQWCPIGLPLVREENVEKREVQVELIVHVGIPIRNGYAYGSINLETGPENPVFKHIWDTFPQGKVKNDVNVTDFGEVRDTCENALELVTQNWTLEGIEIERSMTLRDLSCSRDFCCKRGIKVESSRFLEAWNAGKTFQGVFSISLMFLESPYNLLAGQNARMKTILEEKLETDLELTAKGSSNKIKCHRAILAVSSPMLEDILKRIQNESLVHFMNHLSENCINAFLAFIYYNGMTKVFSSTEMAIQVLQAALEFRVVSLACRIREYLDLKENDQFTAGQAVRLFSIVKKSTTQQFAIRLADDDINSDSQSIDEVSGGDSDTDQENESDDDTFITGENGSGSPIGGGVVRSRESRDDDDVEESQRKRICNREKAEVSGAEVRFNEQGPSGSRPNESEDNSSDSELDTTTIKLSYAEQNILDGLEKRVVELIEWYVRSKGNALKVCDAYKGLESHPKLLMEITDITLELLAEKPQQGI